MHATCEWLAFGLLLFSFSASLCGWLKTGYELAFGEWKKMQKKVN